LLSRLPTAACRPSPPAFAGTFGCLDPYTFTAASSLLILPPCPTCRQGEEAPTRTPRRVAIQLAVVRGSALSAGRQSFNQGSAPVLKSEVVQPQLPFLCEGGKWYHCCFKQHYLLTPCFSETGVFLPCPCLFQPPEPSRSG